MTHRRSRLAPSPTGALHLGNACTFLVNWALARSRGWELILRLEDLVGPRIDLKSTKDTLSILTWLGMEWDGEPIYQSENLAPYHESLASLISQEQVYHCSLSRKEIDQVSLAPHADDPDQKRGVRPDDVRLHNETWDHSPTNWRFIVSTGNDCIDDELRGQQQFDKVDDFVVWTKHDMPAYQLAVVVDDLRQDITDVVRGNDLLESALWQSQLYAVYNATPPKWWHLPLILGEDGRRLAKRHGDTRITTLRTQGVTPERIIGLVAQWTGITHERRLLTSAEFRDAFDIRSVPTEDIVFTKEDHQWLLD